jgi:hypothetical protein
LDSLSPSFHHCAPSKIAEGLSLHVHAFVLCTTRQGESKYTGNKVGFTCVATNTQIPCINNK